MSIMKELMSVNALNSFIESCISSSSHYARLFARLRRRSGNPIDNELTVAGLTNSAHSLVLSSILNNLREPLFFIVSDSHQAAFYERELNDICQYPVFTYPASEISPYEQVLSSPDNIAAQMEVLYRLLDRQKIAGPEQLSSENRPFLVIVPARALMQRVLDKKTLQNNTLTLNVGDELDREVLANKLVSLGYTRDNLVSLRGEFSIRGDIIDIYPSVFEPIRIELFGDQIESIRSFKIDDQRSIEQKKSVLIGPRYWAILKDEPLRQELIETIERITETQVGNLSSEAAETLCSVIEGDKIALAASIYPESVEYYAPFIHHEFATLLDYLPQDALLVLDEWDSVMASLNAYHEKLEKSYSEGLETGRLLPLPHRLHLDIAKCSSNLKAHRRLFFTSLPELAQADVKANIPEIISTNKFDDNDAKKLLGETDDALNNQSVSGQNVFQFECHPVEHFNNQIKVVVEKIREWQAAGFSILVNSEQPQRIMDLLREWNCAVTYLGASVDGNSNAEENDIAKQKSANSIFVSRYGFLHGFVMKDITLAVITDAELFGLKRRPSTYRRPMADKSSERFASIADLKVGDYVVHIKHGIGQFTGVQRISVDKEQREYLTVQYTGDDRLYVPVDQINLLSRYRGAGDAVPRLSKLGGAEWETVKRKVKRSVKQVAEDLVNLYAMRAKQQGFANIPDTPWQYEMEEAFPFEETPDQWQAIVDTKGDLESSKPMDRLICGDVGFGKTEVAIRSAFKVVMSGRQVAVLVPTTILAQQHFNTLSERFAPYPVKVGLLSRFRTAAEQKQVIDRLAVGECDVVVGTHRMLQKDIRFKDLGLVIIDEEQRFGVAHKEKLKQLRVMVDVLTMSATPIPRTLHMALTGARDMSLINTPPTNRAPIKTFVGEYKLPLLRTAILHEMERGGQIYVVHNRVESIEQVAQEIRQLVPEARIIIGHGQMQERELENVMLDFASHQYDILVCTTIIESGLDIPNTNTIIITEADKLGLAQLYQLRGRVGRSDVQAYAYCLYKPDKALSETAQNRLKAIREFTSLGSGYHIALRDMEIRGVGNILGAEQHGHMIAVGFDLYCKLLEESVAELKGEIKAIEADTQIDLNITAYIPETYIADNEQRLVEYKRLADVKTERQLNILLDEWKDRFGNLPAETQQLAAIVKLRLLASQAQITGIKSDMQGIRLAIDFRLQQWLPIQARLPKHLGSKTTYKPGQAGGHGPMPYVLLKTAGLNKAEQLDLLMELINAMLANYVVKAG